MRFYGNVVNYYHERLAPVIDPAWLYRYKHTITNVVLRYTQLELEFLFCQINGAHTHTRAQSAQSLGDTFKQIVCVNLRHIFLYIIFVKCFTLFSFHLTQFILMWNWMDSASYFERSKNWLATGTMTITFFSCAIKMTENRSNVVQKSCVARWLDFNWILLNAAWHPFVDCNSFLSSHSARIHSNWIALSFCFAMFLWFGHVRIVANNIILFCNSHATPVLGNTGKNNEAIEHTNPRWCFNRRKEADLSRKAFLTHN